MPANELIFICGPEGDLPRYGTRKDVEAPAGLFTEAKEKEGAQNDKSKIK